MKGGFKLTVPLFIKEFSEDTESLKIFPLGDFHFEEPSTRHEIISAWLETVERENGYIIFLGDLFDIALFEDISAQQEVGLPLTSAVKTMAKFLDRYKDRIVAVVEGNHDQRIRKRVGLDLLGVLCEERGIPYARGQAGIIIRLGKGRNQKAVSYSFAITHGFGGGRTKGAKAQMRFWIASVWEQIDAVLVGHIHEPAIDMWTRLEVDPRNEVIRTREILLISVPGALGYAEYAQKKSYPPPSYRLPALTLSGREKHIEVSLI